MDLEASPEEIESEAEHEAVPNEDVAVETFGVQKELYGDQHLAPPTTEEMGTG
jgi:hypothetical protein